MDIGFKGIDYTTHLTNPTDIEALAKALGYPYQRLKPSSPQKNTTGVVNSLLMRECIEGLIEDFDYFLSYDEVEAIGLAKNSEAGLVEATFMPEKQKAIDRSYQSYSTKGTSRGLTFGGDRDYAAGDVGLSGEAKQSFVSAEPIKEYDTDQITTIRLRLDRRLSSRADRANSQLNPPRSRF